MPEYTYQCDNCSALFSIFCSIRDYRETVNIKCEHCLKKVRATRNYIEDMRTINTSVIKGDGELKTLGDLANRNRDKLTEDQKIELYSKHNEYKDNQPHADLPKGMSRMKKPKQKISWPKSK